MKHWIKIQVYEIQTILYWILGVLILNIWQMKWVGWVCIVYGWLTFLGCLGYASMYYKEVKECFEDKKN